jgi:hypothetical protein
MDTEAEFNECHDNGPKGAQKFLFLRFAQVGIVEQRLVFLDIDGKDRPRR